MPMPDKKGPIQKEVKKEMQAWGEVLDETFNGKDCKKEDRKWGFCLLIFPFQTVICCVASSCLII